MYVRWKSLFILGIIFWGMLCLTDFLSDDFGNLRYQLGSGDEPWIVEVKQEQALGDFNTKDECLDSTESNTFELGWSLLFWNCVAFLSSLTICSLLRKFYFSKWNSLIDCLNIKGDASEVSPPIEVKPSPSRIPVLKGLSSSITHIKSSESDISNGSAEKAERGTGDDHSRSSSSIQPSKSNTDQLEKQCSKLREEMLVIRATALKEHAVLSRKLETVIKEKRELSKQLAIAHKENRAAKQQLEEMLAERALLIKRLENATKEFKANTKAKKATLGKLEEAEATIETLKQQLEQMTRDKEVLERKFGVLQEEYERLKQTKEQYTNLVGDNSIGPEVFQYENREHVIDKSEGSTEIASTDTNLYQTEIDMQKIQNKILNLEKNLEKFSTKALISKMQIDVDSRNNLLMAESASQGRENGSTFSLDQEGSAGYREIFSRDEENNSAIVRAGQALDSPRRLVPSSILFGDDNLYKIPEEVVMQTNVNQRKNKKQAKLNELINASSLVSEGSGMLSCASASTTASLENDNDSSSDDSRRRQRFVSNSPAFQKFLRGLETEQPVRKSKPGIIF